MKKFFASVLCLGMIASSALLFAGCGTDIYVDGDFSEEATAEEVRAVLTEVEAGDVFGDTSAEDWSFGLNILSDMKVKMDLSVGENVLTSIDLEQHIDMGAAYDAAGTAASGSVEAAMAMAIPGIGSSGGDTLSEITVNLNGEAYIDSDAFYLDGSVRAEGEGQEIDRTGKFVIPSGLGDRVGITVPDGRELSAGIIDALEAAGAKIYIDSSDAAETKVKVSYDADALLDMVGDTGISEVQAILDAMRFDCYDIYFSFVPATGALTAFGTVIEASIPETTVGEGDSTFTVSMEVSGATWYLAGDVTVEEPADLADYQALEV